MRLSKGRNTKDHWSDFILCAYDADPDVEIENVQQVRAVFEHGEWRLHIVCRHETEVESPGNRTAGVDLGICNIAAVSFGDETILFPGGWLKESKHYYKQVEYECEGENGLSRRARNAKRTLKERRQHFHHVLSKHIVHQCVEREVGTIVVGDLGGIRENDDTGEPTNWGDHGNMDLHGWAFDRFTTMLEYKSEAEGIAVVQKSERNTSKSCSACGRTDDRQRVERGLYVCNECGLVANADTNGAENIRQKVLPNLATDGGDRDNGWMAQPAVHLFDRSEGRFAPREQVAQTNRGP